MKSDATGQTDIVRTNRQKPVIDAVVTEIAFSGDAVFFIKINGTVRARVDARFASSAQCVIQNNDSVFSFNDRPVRANIHTGGVLTMPAEVHLKQKVESVRYYFRSDLQNRD